MCEQVEGSIEHLSDDKVLLAHMSKVKKGCVMTNVNEQQTILDVDVKIFNLETNKFNATMKTFKAMTARLDPEGVRFSDMRNRLKVRADRLDVERKRISMALYDFELTSQVTLEK